jgi:hypothetical protein
MGAIRVQPDDKDEDPTLSGQGRVRHNPGTPRVCLDFRSGYSRVVSSSAWGSSCSCSSLVQVGHIHLPVATAMML